LPRIEVIRRPGMPVPGSAHWADGRWIIRVADEDHPRRRRYTIAHEFKHVLDHPLRQVIYRGLPQYNHEAWIERIAEARRLSAHAQTDGVRGLHQRRAERLRPG